MNRSIAAALAGAVFASVVGGATPAGAVEPPAGNQAVATIGGNSALSQASDMTPDGRYVVFLADTAVVPGYDPLEPQVFRLDRTTGAVVAVSVAVDGTPPDTPASGFATVTSSRGPSVSDDGRYVVFESNNDDIVAGDTNNRYDVFLRDVVAGTTTLVSHTPVPGFANGASQAARISGNGRWVTYRTAATDLGFTDTNKVEDVVRWDRTTDTTVMVSVGYPAGTEANERSLLSFPADDGKVAFTSRASNLITTAGFGGADYLPYLRDPTAGTPAVPISQGSTGAFHYGAIAAFTSNGRYVLFSALSKVLPSDTNTLTDSYVRDLTSGTTTLAVAAFDGTAPDRGSKPADLSPDGRFVLASTTSPDVFVRDLGTVADPVVVDRRTGIARNPARGPTGARLTGQVEFVPAAISADGRTYAFSAGNHGYVLPGPAQPVPSGDISTYGVVAPTRILRTFAVGDVGAFVDRQYQDLMGRAATAGERSAAIAAIEGGALREQLPAELRRSSLHGGTIDPVVRLYQAFFLRSPDADGLDYWVAKRQSGWSLGRISDFFAKSNEFKVRYGTKTNQEFVALIYQNILGRPGEPGGEAYWVDQLDTRVKNRGQVMIGFSESTEYRTAQQNATDVSVLFLTMLGRPPTSAERTAYAGDLAQGGPLYDVVGDLLEHPDYDA